MKRLFESAREGVLNLIPKQNKDTRILKNLRPITLLNVDYKILEKVITNRMAPALKYIIDTDQTGFMEGRRLCINLRKMFDTMDFCRVHEIPAWILSLDFMKAFDMCEVESIKGALNFFQFPDEITKWVTILYSDFFV